MTNAAIGMIDQNHGALSVKPFAGFQCSNIEIALSDDMDTIRPVWLGLQDECPHTIYQHYLWQKAWLETLGSEQKAKPLFVTGYLDNKPIFLIPMVVDKTNGLTIATWMGGEHANYRFGLFSPQNSAAIREMMPMLAHELAKNLPFTLDAFELTQQPLSWDGHDNPMAILPTTQSALSGGSLTLDADFNAVLERGNAKRKRKILRGQERALSELGGYQCMRTQNEAEHNALYGVFTAQKKQWFKDRGITNKFDNDATTAFFNRLAHYNDEMPRGEKLLEFDYIYADGEHLSLLAGGTLDGQHFGYFTSMTNDPQYASISPGSLTFYKRIEAACTENMRRVDFGVGAERYKKSWCNENHPLVDVITPISAKGRLYMATRVLKSNMKRMIKDNETLWPLVKSARRLIAGKTK